MKHEAVVRQEILRRRREGFLQITPAGIAEEILRSKGFVYLGALDDLEAEASRQLKEHKEKAMTPQEIFDRVSNHLLTQNAKCSDDLNGCRYHLGTMKCAVGCLIHPAHYSAQKLEGASVSDPDVQNALAASGVTPLDDHTVKLLEELQGIHDYQEPRDWPKRLRKVADEFSLKPDSVKS